MSIRTDLSVNWEVSPRIITVAAPSTSILVQDLHDTCRDIEDDLPDSTPFPHLIDSAGKEPLGGGASVGITSTLQNAKLAFEARPGPTFVSCVVSGGNLVAVDENGVNIDPIQVTDYTQVTISQSASPTIIQPDSDYATMYLLESLRGRNRSIGTVYYWNPTSGNDTNNGLTPAKAVATFAQAQSLAAAGAGDVIFALATASGGITTTTEKLTISKANLKVRGAGYQFQLVPSTNGSPTVTITTDNVEFEGFYISTAAGGTDNGVTATGDSALIKNCWIKGVTGNGIDISSSTRSQIDTCAIEDSVGTGIKIGASTSTANIRQCILSGNGADGADLSGSGVTDNIFENNLIFNNTGYGIDIGTGVTRTGVRLNHTFSGNTAGNTRDLGSGTFIETPSGGASASDIADAVWDELITDHVTANTAGRTLRDAKTRATLASLK